MHARHLLPLQPKDYIARFSMEFVILFITILTVLTNVSLARSSYLLETKDQSLVFSFLKTKPHLNKALLKSFDTATVTVQADQRVLGTATQVVSPNIVLANNTLTPKPSSEESTTIQAETIIKTNPSDSQHFPFLGTSTYEVLPGDTVSEIASRFGISAQTIMKENNLNETSIIKPGLALTILPTTGITHKALAGDTIASIAKKYKADEENILDANNLALPDEILPGDTLVVPLEKVELPQIPAAIRVVKDDSGRVVVRSATAPADLNIGGLSFMWPTAVRTITQRFTSRHSGLDISNSHMVPIYASEAGFVETSGYLTGYGNTIILNHGNGMKTLYGHASELYVTAGDKVAKGQTIAKQGRTGRVRGVTGIHLHFEIIKDGRKLNPLSYVKP